MLTDLVLKSPVKAGARGRNGWFTPAVIGVLYQQHPDEPIVRCAYCNTPIHQEMARGVTFHSWVDDTEGDQCDAAPRGTEVHAPPAAYPLGGNDALHMPAQVIGLRVQSNRPGKDDPIVLYLTVEDAHALMEALEDAGKRLPANTPSGGPAKPPTKPVELLA